MMIHSHMRSHLVWPAPSSYFEGIRVCGHILMQPPLHYFAHLSPMHHLVIPLDPLSHYPPAYHIVACLCEYRPFVCGLSLLLALIKPLCFPFILFQLLVLRHHALYLNVGLFPIQSI